MTVESGMSVVPYQAERAGGGGDPRTVLGGTLMFPAASAGDVVRHWREFMASAPAQVRSGVAFVKAPHDDEVPSVVRGKPVVSVVLYFAGEVEHGRRALAPMLELGPPVVNTVRPVPYAEARALLDDVAAS